MKKIFVGLTLFSSVTFCLSSFATTVCLDQNNVDVINRADTREFLKENYLSINYKKIDSYQGEEIHGLKKGLPLYAVEVMATNFHEAGPGRVDGRIPRQAMYISLTQDRSIARRLLDLKAASRKVACTYGSLKFENKSIEASLGIESKDLSYLDDSRPLWETGVYINPNTTTLRVVNNVVETNCNPRFLPIHGDTATTSLNAKLIDEESLTWVYDFSEITDVFGRHVKVMCD